MRMFNRFADNVCA